MPTNRQPVMINSPVALICGGAISLLDDYVGAKELHPNADTIIVNDVSEILRGDHLFSLHPEKLSKWVGWQYDAFGHTIPTHSYKPPADYIWRELTGCKGTSGWAAAKAAFLMGYTEAILCGVPMDPVPYAKRGPSLNFMIPDSLNIYRDAILADSHDNITSMSGWTRDLLGAPC